MVLFNKGNSYISKAEKALVIGNYSNALEYCNLIITNKANNKLGLVRLGISFFKNLLYKPAKDIFVYSLSLKGLNNSFTKALTLNLALCDWKLGDVKESIRLYESIILDPKYEKLLNIDDWTNVAFICIENNMFDKAIKYTNKTFEFDENHPAAYDNIGQIYYKQKQYEEAIYNFNLSIEYNPETVDSHYYLGKIYEDEGDFELAKDFYEKTLSLDFNPLNSLTREIVVESLNGLLSKMEDSIKD